MSGQQIRLHKLADAASVIEAYDRGAASRMEGKTVREWEMRARLNVMVRRREIAPEVVLHTDGGMLYAYFVRWKPARSRLALPAWISLAAAGALSAIVWLIWESRYILMVAGLASVAAAVLVAVFASIVNGHACSGVHCAGCRG